MCVCVRVPMLPVNFLLPTFKRAIEIVFLSFASFRFLFFRVFWGFFLFSLSDDVVACHLPMLLLRVWFTYCLFAWSTTTIDPFILSLLPRCVHILININ